MTEKEKVPLFKSWRRWYFFVIGVLLLLILLFNLFTNYFA